MMASIEAMAMKRNDRSRCVRGLSPPWEGVGEVPWVGVGEVPLNSFPASPTAWRMMPHDLTMPMMPAMAMPPMPMLRA